jgi:hydrogenase maturation protein HypF
MMVERRAISVDGIVQGVGFRPFVHGLASRLQLQGFVRNQSGEVRIEVEGERGSLDRFLDELTRNPPPLAHIDRVFWSQVSPRGDAQFRIDASEIDANGQVLISPDVATSIHS